MDPGRRFVPVFETVPGETLIPADVIHEDSGPHRTSGKEQQSNGVDIDDAQIQEPKDAQPDVERNGGLSFEANESAAHGSI